MSEVQPPRPLGADLPAPVPVDQPGLAEAATSSVVDAVLDLNAFLSGDVRRAEKTFRFATRLDLEARLDDLDAELRTLVDPNTGQPLAPAGERALGEEDGRSAAVVAAEREAVREEYVASFRSIRLRQLDPDDWQEWRTKWRDELEKDMDEQPVEEMWGPLIAASALRPRITVEQIPALRKQMGAPTFERLALAAFQVNTNAGVSVPKSLRFSVARSLLEHGQS